MSRRILLADDSVTIQKVIELTFMDDDRFEVRPVSNGDEAVALLSTVNPDFVIADVHMPGANGYEVCRRSKQLRPQVPVLLLVGTFEPFDEKEAQDAGADSYLKKPFDSQELLQRVQELLGRAGAAAAAPEVPAELPLSSPDLPPMAESPELPAEPSWGSFSLEPEAPPFPTAPEPFAAPAGFEPFDREPSFTLEPDPGYQVESEPVFTLEEDTPSFAARGDVFGAPDELSLEPQDRYLPEEPAAAAWPAAQEAAAPWAPAEFQPEETDWAAPTEPEPWPAPAEPQPWNTPAEPEPWNAPAEPQPWTEPEPSPWSPQPEPEPPSPAAPVVAAATAAAVSGGGRLADEDVERIARRVAELLSDKAFRDVAWEVIPDMAEVIIRDRLRELEAQVE